MEPKEIKKQIDLLAKQLKSQGFSTSEIEESTASLRQLHADSVESEEKNLDNEIVEKEKEINKRVDDKVEELFKKYAVDNEKKNDIDVGKKNKIFGYKNDKALSELEGEEKSNQFFKSLLKAAVTKDPRELMVVQDMHDERQKALSEGTDVAGGHLVPEEFEMQLIEDLRQDTVMRAAGATSWPMTRRTLELPALTDRPLTSWGSENTSISTTTARFGNLVLTARKLVSRIYTSTELAEDSTPSIVELLKRLFVTALSEEEDKTFFTGNGTTRPKGLNQETLRSISAGGTLTAQHIIRLYWLLGQKHRQNAAWFMSSRTWGAILALTDDNGQFLYKAPSNVLVEGGRPMLYGRPVFETDNVASSEIYFGNADFYYIGDRVGVAITTSTEADDTFAKDQIQIKARKRVDGRLALTSAFTKITSSGVS